MQTENLDYSINSVITPGTQVGQWGALEGLCKFIGEEMNVPMENYDTIKASDPKTEPTFMYLLSPQYLICLVAHGLGFRRSFDPGRWEFNPVVVGNQIREAITSLQAEYDSHKVGRSLN